MEVFSKLNPSKRKVSEGAVSKEDILSTMDNFHGTHPQEDKENEDSNQVHGAQGSIEGSKWEFVDFGQGDETAPASLSHSYSLEWEKLFGRPGMMPRLKEKAQMGDLRSSRFRSVIWKLFLEVLPPNIDQWVQKSRESRAKFDELKNRLIVNPRKAVDSVNLSVNNPLSQAEESPWNKFFQDNELRLTIKQDVIRTFPEVEFFRTDDKVDLMIEILFCFSREHATNSYKQGMHELLAPLIFVLHCDHQAFLHACEIESVLDIMKEVMDPAYLEHDAYSMFCQVMETVEPWYLSRDFSRRNGSLRNLEIINATPFARSQDLNPSNVIVTKLTRIQDYVLKKLDPELHSHLERLEIAPQIYGIRWLRLLFGREFPMQDLLMLWDAIFGDGIGFDLVDYVFVAMLLYLRDTLIASDYTTCLSILMKYPTVQDVHYFVDKALYIREPSQHPRPHNYSHQGNVSVMSSTDSLTLYDNSPSSASNPTSAANSKRMNTKESASHAHGSTVSLSQVEESMFRHTPSASSLARLETSDMRSAQSSPGVHHSNIFPLTPEDAPSETGSPTKFNTLPSKSRNKSKKLTKAERALNGQIAQLQGQLNDKNTMCLYCATKLDVHIERLQSDLFKQNLDVGDSVMVSLAGLKLVRDVLNGTLKFSQTICDESEEISINDGYYAHEENISDVDRGSSLMSPESDILLGATSGGVVHPKNSNSFYMGSEDVSPEGPESGACLANSSLTKHGTSSKSVSNTHSHIENTSGQLLKSNSEEKNVAQNFYKKEINSSQESSDGSAPSQITSRIRSIFKSNTNAQKHPKSAVPHSSSDKPSGNKPNTSLKHMQGEDEHYVSSEREPSHRPYSLRARSKSGDDKYLPLEHEFGYQSNSSLEQRPSRGSHSNVTYYGRRMVDKEEIVQRERSRSQPLNSMGRSANGKDNFNPLYQWKYDQGMDY